MKKITVPLLKRLTERGDVKRDDHHDALMWWKQVFPLYPDGFYREVK